MSLSVMNAKIGFYSMLFQTKEMELDTAWPAELQESKIMMPMFMIPEFHHSEFVQL